MTKKDFLFAVLGGMVLYTPLVFTGYILHIANNDKVFLLYSLFTHFVGMLISIGTILFKCDAPKNALFRTIVMVFSTFVVIIVNGQIGTLRYVDKLLRVHDNEFAGNVRGIFMVFFIFTIVITCIITIAMFAIKRRIRK